MHINMQTLWDYLAVYTFEFKTRCARKISEPPIPNKWIYSRYPYLRKVLRNQTTPFKMRYEHTSLKKKKKKRFVLCFFSNYNGFYLRGGAATRGGPHATEPWQCAAGAPSARHRPQPGTGQGCRG